VVSWSELPLREAMNRKTWRVFVLIQFFGELGLWAGLRMKSALGPALRIG
jgi:hypothetical protein